MRRWRDDRGSSALEVVGLVPLVVLGALVCFQLGAVAFAVDGANSAARDGARAAALGRSAATAVEDSLPGGLTATSVVVAGHSVRVQVEVPSVGFLPTMVVTREVSMP